MEFYQQKRTIKITDLRIGSIVLYGTVQDHIIVGINYENLSVIIRPDKYRTTGQVKENSLLTKISNLKEKVVDISKIYSYPIILSKLNDYGFIWENKYTVYYLIESYKFIVQAIGLNEAKIIYDSNKYAIRTTVYSLHELQNVFKNVSGIDFIDIEKF